MKYIQWAKTEVFLASFLKSWVLKGFHISNYSFRTHSKVSVFLNFRLEYLHSRFINLKSLYSLRNSIVFYTASLCSMQFVNCFTFYIVCKILLQLMSCGIPSFVKYLFISAIKRFLRTKFSL